VRGIVGAESRLAPIRAWRIAFACSLVVATSVISGPAASAEDSGLAAIRASIASGGYAHAVTQARALAADTAPGDPSGPAVRQLTLEALLMDGRGNEAETLALARALVASSVPGSAEHAARERLLGLVLTARGEYPAAATHLRRALREHERVVERTDVALADDLDGLVEVLIWLGHYPAALTASDRAIKIREGFTPSASPGLARSLELRGLLFQRRNELTRAGVDLRRALAIRERAGPMHPALVPSLSLVGDQLKLEEDFAGAAVVLRRAVTIAEASLREGHPDTANALRSLAGAEHRLSNYAEAKALRERALGIAEAAYGPEHPLVAIQLNDLAISFEAFGDFVASRRLMRRALSIYERALGPSNLGVTIATYNLGVRNLAIGDYDEAIRLFRHAAQTWERVNGRQHRFVGLALGALGEALSKAGRTDEALVVLERARAIGERIYGKDSAQIADVLLVLAEIRSRRREHAPAMEDASRVMRIREAQGISDTTVDTYLMVARIASAAGDVPAALSAARRGMAEGLPIFGASHPMMGAMQAELAAALIGSGDRAGALAAALEGERIGREHLLRTLSSLPERQALTYVAARPRGLELALSAMTGSDPAPIQDAVIRGRALTLDEMAQRRRSAAYAADPRIGPRWRDLASASERLAALVVRGPGDLEPRQYQTLLDDVRQQRERAEIALAEASADTVTAIARREVGLVQVRAALPSRSALVSFVRFERAHSSAPTVAGHAAGVVRTPTYLAFVMQSGRAESDVIPLGDAESIDRMIATWRRRVVSTVGENGRPDVGAEPALRRIGVGLRERIWDPVAARLDGIDQVFVVPDGAVNLLPLAALPADAGRYLVEVGPTIHYLSAERDLVMPPIDRPVVTKGLLALGGAAYGPTRTPQVTGPTPTALARGTGTCGTFDSMEFHPLPAARREAEDVAAMWRVTDPNAEVLTGARASEAMFKREAPGRRYLHLATHGFFLGNDCEDAVYAGRGPDGLRGIGGRKGEKRQRVLPDNPLLLSGLALAGANQRRPTRANPEDGILTAEEVSALDLDGVEWAVLSACDTGVGEIKAGEGVFGLRRAFRVAGARTVIMSLWAVEDRSARAWMRPLYEGRLRDHLSTAEAVRHASLAVLAERRAKGLSTHPFYWAGFVAAGDWR
jgi:CHAT domain-containing protein/tetratricopeptide (TPR) repeat protein